MSLMRWYYDDFDRLFDDAFTSRFQRPTFWAPTTTTGTAEREVFRPKMDLHEEPDGQNVTATFDLPGVKPEDVKVEVHEETLTVSGETSSSEQREQSGYKIRERSWGKYSRSLRLPSGTKPDDVRAKMDNGLLNVTFPKVQAQAQPQPQRITID